MGQWTFLELAKRVLEEEKRPLTALEIWNAAKAKGYDRNVATIGKTPEKSVSAIIYVNIRDKEDSPFVKIDSRPKRFYLHSLESTGTPTNLEYPSRVPKPTYREKDLHPFLAYYANLYLKAYVKTVSHHKSKKGEFSEWLHPDMVGCYFPIQEWRDSVIELGNAIASTSNKLFSFELKRELTFANLRESFFQAVSNSSWANEGYLVAAEIDGTDDFQDELKRLTTSFGIGVIKLDLTDPDSSELLFPARSRDVLDWDTINKLMINEDFAKFIERITKDINHKEIWKYDYDPILDKEGLMDLGLASYPPVATTLLETPPISEPSKKQDPDEKRTTKRYDETYSYSFINSFTLNGIKYEVRDWRDVLTRICEIMYGKHRDRFSKVLELKGQKNHWFSTNANDLTHPEQIDESDFYVQNHWSARGIVSVSRATIALFGYSNDDLILDYHKKVDFKKRERTLKNAIA